MKFIPIAALLFVMAQNASAQISNDPPPQAILADLQRVADWQLANLPPKRQPTHWAMGVFYAGVSALAGLSPDPKYEQTLLRTGTKTRWELGTDAHLADDQTISQMYLEMYARYHETAMLQPTRAFFDSTIARPPPNPADLRVNAPHALQKWSWCDALFMAPAAWANMTARTGDTRYLNWMNHQFWMAADYLYDRQQHLFYRDSAYFKARDANGKPVFWGRGDGWVIAGIARILEVMPDNYPARPRYVALFRQLASRLASLQDRSGAWHASLLDAAAFPEPEMSATALNDFGLAWGVNAGILNRRVFRPHVLAGWDALLAHTNSAGRLGYVQHIGREPRHINANDSEVYATGAMLLAGAELYKMRLLEIGPKATITITNPSRSYRFSETVAPRPHPWGTSLMVLSGVRGQIVDSQLSGNSLVFQTDMAPRATKIYYVEPSWIPTPAPIVKTFARYVPERQDDFVWENDRIAHRVYGPTLAKIEGTNNSGIDVWVKSVRRLVADEFYRRADYHVDHGLGGDFYDNGTSRGDGGSGVWSGDTLYVSNNYAKQRLVSSGPLRAEFVLTYAPWKAGTRTVSEVKRFILDAGSNMTRIEETFYSPQPGALDVGIAVVSSDWPGRHIHSKIPRDLQRASTPPEDPRGRFMNGPNWIADFQGMAAAPKGTSDNGMVGVAAIVNNAHVGYVEGHEVLTTRVMPGAPLVYYAGAGWSKFDFPTTCSWRSYVSAFSARLATPLHITVR